MNQIIFINVYQRTKGFKGNILRIIFINKLLYKFTFFCGFLFWGRQEILFCASGNGNQNQFQKCLTGSLKICFLVFDFFYQGIQIPDKFCGVWMQGMNAVIIWIPILLITELYTFDTQRYVFPGKSLFPSSV